jgi:hypothetical protein
VIAQIYAAVRPAGPGVDDSLGGRIVRGGQLAFDALAIAAGAGVNDAFVEAVARYQQRAGAVVDGKAGIKTLVAMFGTDIRPSAATPPSIEQPAPALPAVSAPTATPNAGVHEATRRSAPPASPTAATTAAMPTPTTAAIPTPATATPTATATPATATRAAIPATATTATATTATATPAAPRVTGTALPADPQLAGYLASLGDPLATDAAHQLADLEARARQLAGKKQGNEEVGRGRDELVAGIRALRATIAQLADPEARRLLYLAINAVAPYYTQGPNVDILETQAMRERLDAAGRSDKAGGTATGTRTCNLAALAMCLETVGRTGA